MHTSFWLERMKERDHSENLSVDGVISELIFKNKECESVY
jgi:hypothetical protein